MLHTGIVNILESVKRRHQGASESGLCGGIHVVPLQASGDLSRTVKIGITQVTTHEEVRALEVIPVSVSPKTSRACWLHQSYCAGSSGSLIRSCTIGGGSTGLRSSSRLRVSV